MPQLPSEVVITYDGNDISSYVLASGTTFDTQMNAMAGNCTVICKDPFQELSFITGRELTLTIDGVPMWGGYVTSVRRTFFFPAVNTVERPPDQVKERRWILNGVDYNILFEKRILRNTSNYLNQLPDYLSEALDGQIIQDAMTNYLDVPDISAAQVENTLTFRVWNSLLNGGISSGATTVTVDDVGFFPVDEDLPTFAIIKDASDDNTNREIVKMTARSGFNITIQRGQQGTSAVAHGDGSFILHETSHAWPQQGSPWRAVMQDLVNWNGAVYYIDPEKTLHHHALETAEARWGFSDLPNHAEITNDPGFQDATYGFRDIDANQDGSQIINDAFIWGGSEWAGAGSTVMARRQNTDSIDTHGRWQHAEVHFGEKGMGIQAGVETRADVIVNGAPGSTVDEPLRGQRFPQWNISLSWFAKDVPYVDGFPDHLRAGQLVTIQLQVFDDLELVLPLRSLSISFPAKASEAGKAWVQFTGSFSIQLSDPYTLWRYLLGLNSQGRGLGIATVDGSNPAPYGALFSGEPTPDPDSTETVFNLPDQRGYIAGTTEVYIDGLFMRQDIDYFETDPEGGEITFVTPPDGSSWIWVVCRIS